MSLSMPIPIIRSRKSLAARLTRMLALAIVRIDMVLLDRVSRKPLVANLTLKLGLGRLLGLGLLKLEARRLV